MKSQKVEIAEIVLNINSDKEYDIPDKFVPFLVDKDAFYTINLEQVTNLPEKNMTCDYVDDCFSLCTDQLDVRYYHPDFANASANYAYTKLNLEEDNITVGYLKNGYEHLNSLSNIFFHIGLEEILMNEGRMILHSCCIKTKYGGILFSGPSGIGKSTQGELWKKYENAELINGDRSILYKKEDRWIAYGSPYAGSSNCYVQDSVPITAIVMLKQGGQSSIRKLGIAESYRRIFAMLTVCDWNMEFMNRQLEQLEALITDIEVYELECTPDQSAVNLLKQILSEKVVI